MWAEKLKDSDGDDAESASEDYVPYELSSEAVGMQSAQRLMEVNGAEKKWLEDMGQYYTEYVNGDTTYKIWFEDVKSIEEKLKVMNGHGFAGAAFWKLGFRRSCSLGYDFKVYSLIVVFCHMYSNIKLWRQTI